METKNELRKKAKQIRKTLDMEKFSKELLGKICRHPAYICAQNVMLFYPIKDEVNLLELLNDEKNFYFPRVNSGKIEVCPYNPGDKLEKSCFNIPEPCGEAITKKRLDLVILPALMADKRGYRLGYGGGFYDRFLDCPDKNFTTICPVPSPLFVENLPVEDFDIPADIVIH